MRVASRQLNEPLSLVVSVISAKFWLACWLLVPKFQVRILLSTDIFLPPSKRSESPGGYCSAIKMPAVEFSSNFFCCPNVLTSATMRSVRSNCYELKIQLARNCKGEIIKKTDPHIDRVNNCWLSSRLFHSAQYIDC